MDDRTPAFGIRIGKSRRTWIVLRQPNRTKVSLGHYPDLPLADARRLAMLTLGSPARPQRAIAYPDAKRLYLEQGQWRPHTRRVIASSLGHFKWTKQLSKIDRHDVDAALRGIAGNSARAHALKELKTFLRWCIPSFLEVSPCEGMRSVPQKSRERVLSDDELVAVWLAAEQVDNPLGTIVQLLIVTGQRKMEIGTLTAAQIGTDRITLPSAITKNAREHVLPLGRVAAGLLPTHKAGYLFRATASSARYNGYTYHLKQLQKASGTANWTLHDLRRTFATNLARLGIPIHVTEKLLNHVSGTLSGVAAIYNRHTYFQEMADALQLWETHLLEMIHKKTERLAA